MSVGLMSIAAPALLAACLFHELGPRWLISDRLLTRVSNVTRVRATLDLADRVGLN
jgi:hypothetical protein